jgi:hypothetical protein
VAELITILVDIALGALAYRLAYENRQAISALRADVDVLKELVARAGLS